VVPTAAVQRGPDGTFVYVVKDDNSVTVRPVMVQQQDDLQAVIASGLMAPERVVTTGFGRLSEGTKVEVTNAEEAGQIASDPAQPPARRDGNAPKGKGDPKGKGQRQQGAGGAQGAGAQGAGAPGGGAQQGAAAPNAGAPGAETQGAGAQGAGGSTSAAPSTTP
jgi:multidrug efflux system membrane fusion protein